MNTTTKNPLLERLRHHVTGSIERGEAEAIIEQTNQTDTEKLAREFARVVLLDVGAENHAELLEKTKAILSRRDSICATHDYCDANESMLEAWRNLYGSEPFRAVDTEQAEHIRESELAEINAAWSIAKSNLFWLE
jgi:hypothetical protein